MDKFFKELRRRNVFRVAGVYAVIGWLLIQVIVAVKGPLHLPGWTDTFFVVLVLAGFPIAILFAWAFELTPEGVKLTRNVSEEESIAARTGRKLDYAIIIGLALVGVIVIGDRLLPQRAAPASVAAADAETDLANVSAASIAVLPFADMSPAGDQEYFSDGIAEEILNVLARLPDLKVAGRTSSFKFKGVNEDLRLIGEELGVANILEGSVRKQGERVRITVQLIKADDGFHLWSKTYDRELTDIFAVQDEISEAVADALSVTLSNGVRSSGATVDPRAYDLYLQARQLLAMRRANTILESATLFEAAAILDPSFDAAYSGLSRAMSLATGYTLDAYGDYYRAKARKAANEALEINPRNAEAHSVLGFLYAVFDWDVEAALRETQLAVAAAPQDAEIVNFAGDVYRLTGDYENTIKWEELAAELDPLLVANQADVGWGYLLFRECEPALEAFVRARAIDPKNSDAQEGYGRAQLCMGDIKGAEDTVAAFEKNNPDLAVVTDLKAHVAFAAGRTDEMRSLLKQLEARADNGEQLAYSAAVLHAMLGNNDEATRWLKRAMDAREWYFATDTYWPVAEDWPDYPPLQAVLADPQLKPLFDARRKYLAAHPRGQGGG